MSGSSLPVLPESAPFPAEHIRALNSVMAQSSVEQRHWLSGFLAGYHAATAVPVAACFTRCPPQDPLDHSVRNRIGQCRRGRRGRQESCGQAGLRGEAARHGRCHSGGCLGGGEPSGDRQHLGRRRSAGACGRVLPGADGRGRAALRGRALRRAGARRFRATSTSARSAGGSTRGSGSSVARASPPGSTAISTTRRRAADWTRAALDELARIADPEPEVADARGAIIHVDFASPAAEPVYSKANPFPAEITELVNLNGSRSTKETIHLELSLEGSGLTFEPGDSLGIVARNDPEMVEAVLRAVGLWRRRAAGRPAERRVRHHGALASGDRGLRQGQSGGRPSRSDPRRSLARLSRRPPDRRPARGFPVRAGARAAAGLAAQAAGAALLDRLIARGDAGRGAPPGWRRALPEPRPRAQGRRVRLRRRATAGRRGSSKSTSSRTRTSACPRIPTGRSS